MYFGSNSLFPCETLVHYSLMHMQWFCSPQPMSSKPVCFVPRAFHCDRSSFLSGRLKHTRPEDLYSLDASLHHQKERSKKRGERMSPGEHRIFIRTSFFSFTVPFYPFPAESSVLKFCECEVILRQRKFVFMSPPFGSSCTFFSSGIITQVFRGEHEVWGKEKRPEVILRFGPRYKC